MAMKLAEKYALLCLIYPKQLMIVYCHNFFSSQVDQLNICPGHPDEYLVSMVNSKKGKTIFNSSGDVAAYVDNEFEVHYNKQKYSETVRTSDCLILTKNNRCLHCTSYRHNLKSMYHKWLRRQAISPSKLMNSHVNERWLNSPERKEK